jgi:hypothetical protein
MAAVGGNDPLVPHMKPCAPCSRIEWMGNNPPKQGDVIFVAVEGVYGPQNTPMLWRCIIAGTKERFEGHKHPQPPHKIHPQAWGAVTHPFKALAWSATRPHVGRLGAISAGGGHGCGSCDASCVLSKATEKSNEITKTSFLLTIIISITICCKTYCSSHTANCSVARAQVGAQPEPEPLWSNGPRLIGYRRKALVIVRMILTLF